MKIVIGCFQKYKAITKTFFRSGKPPQNQLVKNKNMNLKSQIKKCPTCNRPFHNRKKWESRGIWDQIIYCSKRCGNQRKK
jgi:hypothetical protein